MLDTLPKLAVYLDEIDDDPAKAAKVAVEMGITKVCLRTAWSREVAQLGDDACAILSNILATNNLSTVLLYSSAGEVAPSEFGSCTDQLNRAIAICHYFKCKSLRVGYGKSAKVDKLINYVDNWCSQVTDRCLASDILPLLEITPDSPIQEPAAISTLLNRHKRIRLIYDPAMLVATRKIEPFTRYWSLLKHKVAFFDIHDYRSGEAPKPPGHGDGQLDLTLSDAILSKFSGWYTLEPGLGRRHGSRMTTQSTFAYAMTTLEAILKRIGVNSWQST